MQKRVFVDEFGFHKVFMNIYMILSAFDYMFPWVPVLKKV